MLIAHNINRLASIKSQSHTRAYPRLTRGLATSLWLRLGNNFKFTGLSWTNLKFAVKPQTSHWTTGYLALVDYLWLRLLPQSFTHGLMRGQLFSSETYSLQHSQVPQNEVCTTPATLPKKQLTKHSCLHSQLRPVENMIETVWSAWSIDIF